MIRPLRRAHRLTWWILAVALAVVLIYALTTRPEIPTESRLPDVLRPTGAGGGD